MEQHAHNNLLFKFSILLLIAAGIFGYYWYQNTQAGTTINTTISTNDDLENGLIGHWTFDGPNMAWGSTTAEALDLSSSSLEGDVTNMDMTAVTTGKIGQALQFDGVNDRVDMGDVNAFDSLTSGSGCAWVKPRTITSDDTIFSKWTPSPDYDGLFFFRDDVSQSGRGDTFTILLDQTGASTTRLDSAAQASKLNTWAHVCYTFTLNTAGGLRLYVNGIEDPNSPRSTAGLTSIDANAAFQIGNTTSDAGLRESDMIIDDVRVYNRALSASEVKRLYELGGTTHINTTIDTNDNLENGLIGHWTFDGPKMDLASTTAEVKNSVVGNGDGNLSAAPGRSGVAPGRIGQAVDLYKVGFGNPTISFTRSYFSTTSASQAHSFFTWIRTAKSSGYADIIGQYGGAQGFILSLVDGHLTYYKSSSGFLASSTRRVADNTWHHVGFVKKGSGAGQLQLYIDGVPSGATSTDNDTFFATNDTTIGYVGFDAVNALLDDMRIYNTALSTSTIKRLYELGATTHINTTIDTNDDLENGLVGHWTFDGPKMAWSSSTAEVLDSSASSIEGDMVSLSQQSASPGRIGQGLNFVNGVDSYISMPANASINDLTTKTVSFWMKPRSLGQSNTGTVLGKLWFVTLLSGNRVYISERTNGEWQSPANSVRMNEWQHVTYTYDSSSALNDPVIYINGNSVTVSELTGPGSASSDASTNLRIGNFYSGTTLDFDGVIDDVRIYNRILSASEVKRLYELGGGQ